MGEMSSSDGASLPGEAIWRGTRRCAEKVTRCRRGERLGERRGLVRVAVPPGSGAVRRGGGGGSRIRDGQGMDIERGVRFRARRRFSLRRTDRRGVVALSARCRGMDGRGQRSRGPPRRDASRGLVHGADRGVPVALDVDDPVEPGLRPAGRTAGRGQRSRARRAGLGDELAAEPPARRRLRRSAAVRVRRRGAHRGGVARPPRLRRFRDGQPGRSPHQGAGGDRGELPRSVLQCGGALGPFAYLGADAAPPLPEAWHDAEDGARAPSGQRGPQASPRPIGHQYVGLGADRRVQRIPFDQAAAAGAEEIPRGAGRRFTGATDGATEDVFWTIGVRAMRDEALPDSGPGVPHRRGVRVAGYRCRRRIGGCRDHCPGRR